MRHPIAKLLAVRAGWLPDTLGKPDGAALVPPSGHSWVYDTQEGVVEVLRDGQVEPVAFIPREACLLLVRADQSADKRQCVVCGRQVPASQPLSNGHPECIDCARSRAEHLQQIGKAEAVLAAKNKDAEALHHLDSMSTLIDKVSKHVERDGEIELGRQLVKAINTHRAVDFVSHLQSRGFEVVRGDLADVYHVRKALPVPAPPLSADVQVMPRAAEKLQQPGKKGGRR